MINIEMMIQTETILIEFTNTTVKCFLNLYFKLKINIL